MVWVITIIILGFVLMGAVLWVVWIGVAVSETAMKSKAKKLSLALGYADYRDAVMQLGLAKTRSYRMVPASDVFHALQNEQHLRSTKDRGMNAARPALRGSSKWLPNAGTVANHRRRHSQIPLLGSRATTMTPGIERMRLDAGSAVSLTLSRA